MVFAHFAAAPSKCGTRRQALDLPVPIDPQSVLTLSGKIIDHGHAPMESGWIMPALDEIGATRQSKRLEATHTIEKRRSDMKYVRYLIAVSFLAVLAGGVLAEEAAKEDLSACKLPHGELLLPDRNHRQAAKGYFLRFSDGALNPSPFKGKEQPDSLGALFERLRKEHTGDLAYSGLHEGTFVAVSGRIADLGRHFLHELSGRRLARAHQLQDTESP